MNFYFKRKPINGSRYGIGFKSKKQLPLVMIWKEFLSEGEVCDACVIYSSYRGYKA